jgi:hypothetical protein
MLGAGLAGYAIFFRAELLAPLRVRLDDLTIRAGLPVLARLSTSGHFSIMIHVAIWPAQLQNLPRRTFLIAGALLVFYLRLLRPRPERQSLRPPPLRRARST